MFNPRPIAARLTDEEKLIFLTVPQAIDRYASIPGWLLGEGLLRLNMFGTLVATRRGRAVINFLRKESTQ